MPRGLKLKKLGTATGLTALDIVLKKVDETYGHTILGVPTATTIARAGLFALGLIGDALVDEDSKLHPYFETMYIAEEPLLGGTLAKGAGLVADYEGAPSREAIELRLRSAGQNLPPRIPGRVQFR